MHLRLVLLVTATCLFAGALSATTASKANDVTTAAAAAAVTTAKPQGFSSRSLVSNDDDEEFESQAQTHLAYRQRPVYDYSQSVEEEQEEPAPRQYYQNRNVKQQNNYLKQTKQQSSEELESEEEEEVEEPDKLSLLLAKSTFNCNARNTGYYADETVNCEVFHYCQDNQRHSWVCPDGFTFHQIHLICMPPSNENICQQSSKYHIVNDYLYKPLNLEEHQSKPNVTLRYSERYYPDHYYENERYDDVEEAPRQRPHQQRQPLQVGFRAQQQQQQHSTQQPQLQYEQQPRQQSVQQVRHQPVQQTYQPAPAPQQTTVYRRPIPTSTTTRAPVIQQQIQQHRPQTVAPSLVTPTPYRFFSAAPQQVQVPQQVFRTPEEINISLQQRRPQFFVATTPRYYEDEYLYERRK